MIRQVTTMKSSREYWRDRQIEAFLRSEKNALNVHKDMKAAYQSAADDINDEIAKLYARLGRKNKISQHELLKYLDSKELQRWRSSLEEYIRKIRALSETDPDKAQALLLELDMLSGKSKINRLDAIQAQITAQMAYLAQIEERAVQEHLISEYKNSYYASMYAAYQTNDSRVLALMQTNHVRISPAKISSALSLPWSGANYSARIWGRQYNIAAKIKQLVAKQLLTGASVQRLTKDITNELGKDYKYAAERLIRTETAFVHAQADIEVYNRLGIEKYQFLATLDNKTSEICRSLDLKYFPVEHAQVGKNYPPMHPNCRSTTVMYNPADPIGTRKAKGEDGKYYEIPSDMSYQQWYNYVENAEFEFPDVQDRQLQQVAKELREVLEKNDSGHAKRMLEAIERTEYIESPELMAAFAYSTKKRAVLYNPGLIKKYVGLMDFVEVHELSHKLDFEVYRSWNNESFTQAIQAAKKTVSALPALFASWFDEDGKYVDCIGVSDIISALSNNEILTRAQRPADYWDNPMMLSAEIFANLSAIDLLEQVEKADIKKHFPMLWDAYKEMVNEE